MIEKDYLIVGLGLSGLALSRELEKEGKSFFVYENHSQFSSRVAGGIMNPVILKRFTLAWDAHLQMPVAVDFYKELEKKIQQSFIQKLSIYRRFSSIKEQNDWFAAADKPIMKDFLSVNLTHKISNIKALHAFGEVKEAYVVNTEKLLDSYSSYLREKECWVEEEFQHHQLELHHNYVSYKGIKAKKIFFCEGVGMHHNPFFNTLPLGRNKGEYLLIKSPELHLEKSVKSAVFIHPLGNDTYKVGATYDHMATSPEPTKQAKQQLIKQLDKLIDCPYEVIGQEAGLRPTVIDRKPLLGSHKEHKNVLVCNGFGSRGVMIAPNAAKWLMDYSERNIELPREVSIKRFQE